MSGRNMSHREAAEGARVGHQRGPPSLQSASARRPMDAFFKPLEEASLWDVVEKLWHAVQWLSISRWISW
jgi:hypothetical protein